MGQYYRPCLLTKSYKKGKKPVKLSLSCYNYNNGAKLMEHSYVRNKFVRAVTIMLSDNTTNAFVWGGDYADAKFHNENMYHHAEPFLKKGLETIGDLSLVERVIDYKYIINHSKKEYIAVPHFNPHKLTIHPLPLLTVDGNGRGCGDYHGTNMEYVGIWAYNIIQCSNEIPNGYKEIAINFAEDF